MKEYKIEKTENKKNSSINIGLSGLLNITNISEIKKEIDKLLKNKKEIELKIDNPEDIDLSLIQLLIALREEHKMLKNKINIKLELNGGNLELFKRAGLLETFN
jgi:ABC-type transporter Mla MlaB component